MMLLQRKGKENRGDYSAVDMMLYKITFLLRKIFFVKMALVRMKNLDGHTYRLFSLMISTPIITILKEIYMRMHVIIYWT